MLDGWGTWRQLRGKPASAEQGAGVKSLHYMCKPRMPNMFPSMLRVKNKNTGCKNTHMKNMVRGILMRAA